MPRRHRPHSNELDLGPLQQGAYVTKHGNVYADFPALSDSLYDATRSQSAKLPHVCLAALPVAALSIPRHVCFARAQKTVLMRARALGSTVFINFHA